MTSIAGSAHLNIATALFNKGHDSEYTDFEPDPRSSDGKSGLPPKQEYFIPKTPDPTKRDDNEFQDYQGTIYSPYAFLRLPYRIIPSVQPSEQPSNNSETQFAAKTLEPGFYLVKIALPPEAPSIYQQKRKFPWFSKSPARIYTPQVLSMGQMILKREGEIVAAVNIESQSSITMPSNKKEAKRLAKTQRKIDPVIYFVPETVSSIYPNALQLEYCDQNLCYRSRPLSTALLK